jgi:putative oxidoreductase
MWTLFGFDHAAHYFISVALPASTAYVLAAGELLGAVMLLTGVYIRPVAIALLPVAIGTGLVHFGTGVGASLGYSAYLACCLLGQALLASRVLTQEAGTDESPMLEDLSRAPKTAIT